MSNKMTEQEQNQAIAEAIGMKYHKPTEAEIKGGSYYQYEPQFTRDLNAIHEAEGILLPSHQIDFAYHLKELACPITGEDWMAIHSTAAQRAEAFLRTIGKWKD